MDTDTVAKLMRQGQADQRLEGIKEVAQVMGAYRAALIDSGLPVHEAYFLTRDYNRLLMTKSLWPDSPPPFGEGE